MKTYDKSLSKYALEASAQPFGRKYAKKRPFCIPLISNVLVKAVAPRARFLVPIRCQICHSGVWKMPNEPRVYAR